MTSINVDLDYFDHPKTRRLTGLLGRGSEAIPIRLWCYAGKHHSGNGELTGYSTQEVESVMGWQGVAGKAVQALLTVGFLEKTDTGFKVHDWEEHAGHIAVHKAKASAMARARWSRVREAADRLSGDPPRSASSDAASIASAGQGSTYTPCSPPEGGEARRSRGNRATRGSAPPAFTRSWREGPPWVQHVGGLLNDPARPGIPDPWTEAFFAWCKGTEGSPPLDLVTAAGGAAA